MAKLGGEGVKASGGVGAEAGSAAAAAAGEAATVAAALAAPALIRAAPAPLSFSCCALRLASCTTAARALLAAGAECIQPVAAASHSSASTNDCTERGGKGMRSATAPDTGDGCDDGKGEGAPPDAAALSLLPLALLLALIEVVARAARLRCNAACTPA